MLQNIIRWLLTFLTTGCQKHDEAKFMTVRDSAICHSALCLLAINYAVQDVSLSLLQHLRPAFSLRIYQSICLCHNRLHLPTQVCIIILNSLPYHRSVLFVIGINQIIAPPAAGDFFEYVVTQMCSKSVRSHHFILRSL